MRLVPCRPSIPTDTGPSIVTGCTMRHWSPCVARLSQIATSPTDQRPLPGPRIHLPHVVLGLVVRRFEHRLAIIHFPGRDVGMRMVVAVAAERPQLIGEAAEERRQRLVGGGSISPHAVDRGEQHAAQHGELRECLGIGAVKTREARNWWTSRITPPPGGAPAKLSPTLRSWCDYSVMCRSYSRNVPRRITMAGLLILGPMGSVRSAVESPIRPHGPTAGCRRCIRNSSEEIPVCTRDARQPPRRH